MARETDFPLTYVLINPLNRRLVRPLAALRVTPTMVTLASLAFALAAAYCIQLAVASEGPWGWYALGLGFISHTFDALDGDLARYAGTGSARGGVIDALCDRIREMSWVLAIGYGSGWASSVMPAVILCMSGAHFYFYLADGPIRIASAARRHEAKRWRFTLGPYGSSPTRIKLGLFEPFIYALPTAVALGLEVPALYAFGSVFWAAIFWKVGRVRGA